MLGVRLQFRQWGGVLGFLTLVFLLFFFDVACWASISLVGWVRVFEVGFSFVSL